MRGQRLVALFALLLMGCSLPLAQDSGSSATWSRSALAEAIHLRGVFFIDENEGWAVGDLEHVLHSTDGGKTWEKQLGQAGPVGTPIPLQDVWFSDNKSGWAIGQYDSPHGEEGSGVIRRTTNGGQTWDAVDVPPPFTLVKVQFLGQNGWIPEGIRTADGGTTWEKIQLGQDFQFISKDVGYYVAGSSFYKTGDGGKTWKHIPLVGQILKHREEANFYALSFVSDKEGWIAGKTDLFFTKKEETMVAKTEDGGETWKEVSRIHGKAVIVSTQRNLHFADSKRGWLLAGAAGLTKIYHTKDGGVTWDEQLETNDHLSAIFFVNAKRGWAVGSEMIKQGKTISTRAVVYRFTQ